MSNKGDQRRLSGIPPPPPPPPPPYDRQQPFTEHVIPPGPSTPYNFYDRDRFGPEELPSPGFREGYNNDYVPPPGPAFWQPERDLFSGTQSPERFRPPQADGWQRSGPWPKSEAGPWPERRDPPPFTPQWSRGQRDTTATRMFEPSDNWKQIHGERRRGRDHISPIQPVPERYRPYSPPAANGIRTRFPPNNQRSDLYRPPSYEAEPWAIDDGEPYDSIIRDHRAATLGVSTTTPDRIERRRGPGGEDRSVTPVSPRSTQHPSPSYGSFSTITKRESPELPHLEAVPQKPGPAVQVPPAVKPPSLSPSHSSSGSSVNLPHLQIPFAALPPKPQFQPQSRPPTQLPPHTQANVPLSQLPPIPLSAPVPTPFLPQEEQLRPLSFMPQLPSASQQPQMQGQTVVNGNGRSYGRRPVIHNAPSFVPSTLAIDKPLMYPTESATSEADKHGQQAPKSTPVGTQEDVPGSDMDVSLPATPVRAYTPSVDQRSDHTLKAKGLREEIEPNFTRSSRSPPHTTQRMSDADRGPHATGSTVVAEDADDDSDMDMSPPASPLLNPLPTPVVTVPVAPKESSVEVRPSLAIDTSVSSPQLPHELLRLSTSASPVPTTPENVLDADGGDESDMDMSTPTSETAPSPFGTLQTSVPGFNLQNALDVVTSSELPGLTLTAAVTPEPVAPDSAPLDSAPRAATPSDAVPPSNDQPSPEHTAANTPDRPPPTPVTTSSREVSVQVSPRLAKPVPLERVPTDAGELSPPASEETLREETEGVDKEQETVPSAAKDTSLHQKDDPMPVDTPPDRVMTDIPLSDALRLVAKLRFRHDPITQDARIEPILISNRQLVESEPAEEPAPRQEAFVQSVAEKEHRQIEDGIYNGTKHSLRKRFAQHQAALAEKVVRLRKEYLALHERWMVHCAKLDDVARASALEEAAAAACRTTRRTTAMGDAVRSDLEMEQIIASLGNEELTDANHLSAKNAAVIPDMASVTKGRVDYLYDDTNNLVEDPHEFYRLETGINDWTDMEKAIFVEKYAVYPKQFGIIADFLPNKTPSQCVTFYYLHKNTTIDFRKAVLQYNTLGKRRRSGRGKQKGNALLADILKHDDEVGRDSTPSSGRRKRGAPSTSATPVPPSSSAESIDQSKRSTNSRRGTAQNTPDATPDPESSGKRPRRRANPSFKAVAAMELDNPEDVTEEEGRPIKRTRKTRKSKAEVDDTDDALPTPTEVKTVDLKTSEVKAAEQPPEQPPVRKKIPGSGSSWSAEDKASFLKLLAQYGDDFKRIASSMPNKTTVQVAAFYRANVTEMELAKVAALAPKRSPTPQENHTTRHHAPNIPGAGIMTPIFKRAYPGVENGAASMAVSRSRSSGRMSPPPNPSGTQSTETDKRPTSAAQRNPAASSTPSILSRPLQYQGGLAAAFAGMSRSQLTEDITRRPTSPFKSTPSRPPQPPLTITFPSALAYSNLSPSNFAGEQRAIPRTTTRPTLLHPHNSSMMMEFSEFAPQPWQVPPMGHGPVMARQGQAVPPGATAAPDPNGQAGLPMALETTDDLVRYLEHRTRMTAGQGGESDFM